MIDVRRACLQTLEILRNRALDSNITYLKSRNVLPLFYFFLQDTSNEIRAVKFKAKIMQKFNFEIMDVC